jgi:pyrroloquinoline quinone biosynthesis protein D
MMARDSRPRLATGVRLRFDRVAGRMMLLAPERGVALDRTGRAILDLCTGEHRVVDIVLELLPRYEARCEDIEGDVLRFLRELEARRFLVAAPRQEPK